MPAIPDHRDAAEDATPSPPMTEAEALCSAILDMGASLSYDFGHDRPLLGVDGDRPTIMGAIVLFQIIADRAEAEDAFREDVISAVAHLGTYLCDAPGYDAALKTAPAARVIGALAGAGLLTRYRREAGDNATAAIFFEPISDIALAPNAHLLMGLAAARFTSEPDFARYVESLAISPDASLIRPVSPA